jgi:hypothetical protein
MTCHALRQLLQALWPAGFFRQPRHQHHTASALGMYCTDLLQLGHGALPQERVGRASHRQAAHQNALF